MKRIYVFLMAAGFATAVTSASAGVTPVRLGLSRKYQIFQSRDVWGVDLGLWDAGSYSSDRSVGVQMGLWSVANKESVGLSAALFINGSVRNTGVQIGGINGGTIHGMKLGVVNGALFSDEAKEAAGFKSDVGLQVAVANIANVRDRKGVTRGVQAGLLNSANEIHGAQIGIVNGANRLSGIQIGLLNVVFDREGPTSMLPIFNAGF